VGERFSAPVQIGPGAHPAYCTVGTECFPGVESGRGVTLTPHPLLVPRTKNKVPLAIPLLSLRAFVACEKGKTYPLNMRLGKPQSVRTFWRTKFLGRGGIRTPELLPPVYTDERSSKIVIRTYQTIRRHILEDINQHKAKFQLKENTAKYGNCRKPNPIFTGHQSTASQRSRLTPGSAWNINIRNVLYMNIWENDKQKQLIYIQNNSRWNTGLHEKVLRLGMRLAVYFIRHNIQGSTDVGRVPQPGKTPPFARHSANPRQCHQLLHSSPPTVMSRQ
jgi:hypothetical protein